MLHYFDRASMAHSLEVRVPFLDHHLVEYCATIPARHQGPPRDDTKHVLKEAARGLIPDQIIDKREDRLLRRLGRPLVRARRPTAAIADYLLAPEPALRRVPRPRHGRAARRRARRRHATAATAGCCWRS